MSPTFFGGPPPVIRPAGVTAAPRPPWRSAVRCGRAWPARRQSAICERTKTQRTQIKACERFMPHGYDARSWVPNSGRWPFGYLCVTWHTHSRSPHADVLLCVFVNAGTGVMPFAEDPGSRRWVAGDRCSQTRRLAWRQRARAPRASFLPERTPPLVRRDTRGDLRAQPHQ